jgi:putative transposase
VGRRRVWELLMRLGGLRKVHRGRWRHSEPSTAVRENRVQRNLVADRPDALWFTDSTQHRTGEGWVYCAAVLEVYSPSRSLVGRSRTAPNWSSTRCRWLVGGAATQPAPWVHSDSGPQYTSWLFGHRLREAGLLGYMGKAACAYDSSVIESFFGSLQIELLDRRHWSTRVELANAIFEWIEAFYNPTRRHSALGYLSPIDYENRDTTTEAAA